VETMDLQLWASIQSMLARCLYQANSQPSCSHGSVLCRTRCFFPSDGWNSSPYSFGSGKGSI